jgi:FtsP/CotA-like multicopper oxidase with cupredoxin domain
MRECLVEMVDGSVVYHWAFAGPDVGVRVPGPVILCEAGGDVVLDVTNELGTTHGFAVPGLLPTVRIAPGETVRIAFHVAEAGTYLYLDPLAAPINREMGLAGALIATPRQGNTPYTHPTAQIQRLFDDLGRSPEFPGQPWDPARTWLWVFGSVDPEKHALLEAAGPGGAVSPADFLDGYLPSYFTLNGRSGYFAVHDPANAPHGSIGQPALIRTLNLGLVTSSPHVHGNHVHVLSGEGPLLLYRPVELDTWSRHLREDVVAVDTFPLRPLETKDVLLPYIRPPDAHPWPPSDPSVFTAVTADGTRGLVYPMHCHLEMSQTAAGGNYPQGLLTHWVIDGDLTT